MTQFRIDVVVDPRRAVAGTKSVERGLTDLERRANATQLSIIRLFRQAFGALTIGFAIRELVLLADAFTNLQNRLRVVTDGQEDLRRTTEALLQVSNRSRSSFESTAELYSRLALATREQSLAGSELLKITESINKAIILSGASAKEANNGLIQLSQGLASGRLTGDELRSTLEQLPVVADVIAKQLGVTRGELRALGAEGLITSEQIIKAFQNSREELEQRFANTIPTLSQSFVVLRNNVQAFLGEINEGTGLLRGFGAALRFVGENVEFLVRGLVALGATLLSIRLAPAIQRFVDLNRAIAEGRAVRLGSIAAINAQRAALVKTTAATVAELTAEQARIKGVIFATRQEVVHNNAIVGKNAAILALGATEQRLIPVRAQLAAVTAKLAEAEAAHSAAATAAATRVTIFSQAATRARGAVTALTGAITKNPLGAFVVALTAIVSSLVIFRNEIKLVEGRAATLGDFFAELFDQIGTALSVIVDAFRDTFGPALDVVTEFISKFKINFEDVIRFPAAILDSLIGIFVGTFNAIIEIFRGLPAALGTFFINAVNLIIDAIEFLPDVFIGIIKSIGQTLDIFINGQIAAFSLLGASAQAALSGQFGQAKALAEDAARASSTAFDSAFDGIGDRFTRNIAAEVEDEFIPRLTNSFEGGAADLANRVSAAFTEGLGASPVLDFVNSLLAGAQNRAADREAAQATGEKAEADAAAAKAAAERAMALEELLAPLNRETELLNIAIASGQREADIRAKVLDIEKKAADAKLKLTDAELEQIEAQLRQNQSLEEQLALKQRLIPVEERLAEQTRIAREAFASGAIDADMLAGELRNIELAAAEAGKSIDDGLTRFLIKAKEEAQDLASVTEDILTASFSAAEDALVEFATTGQLSFRDFANSLIKDITRIIVKLLILKAIEAIGGAGGAEGVTGALQEGGLATANQPFLVGEEGPEIFTPGQTGSVTPTDQTIEALAGGAANRGETVVVPTPAPQVNVQTVVVDDPNKVPEAMQSPDGQQAMLNVINMNRSNIKRTLG